MQVTSDYYRCRAQRAASAAESLTLLGENSPASHSHSITDANQAQPLSPSRSTLRGLANLYKSEAHNRVA